MKLRAFEFLFRMASGFTRELFDRRELKTGGQKRN